MKDQALRIFADSVLAGVMISIGCTVSLSVGGGIPGAFLFAVGLLAICVLQYSLFTGKVCYAKSGDALRIIFILIGNLIGTFGMAFVISFSKPGLIEAAETLSETKLAESWHVIILGILCNMLIYIAVEGFRREQHGTSGALLLVLCVMVFILCGFEHSIANSFYLALGGKLGEARTWSYLIMNIIGNAIGGLLICRVTNKAA